MSPSSAPSGLDSGRPLTPALRTFYESRFGYDFSSVRIHSGERAATSVEALDAEAYTIGTHIVLGRGRSEGARADRFIMAHELAHVLQQRGAEGVLRAPVSIQRFSKKACRAQACGNHCQHLDDELKLAISFVGNALDVMRRTPLPASAKAARRWLFLVDDDSKDAFIIEILKTMKRALERTHRTTNIGCIHDNNDPAGAKVRIDTSRPPGELQTGRDSDGNLIPNSTEDGPTMYIYPSYISLSRRDRAIALVHESAHLASVTRSSEIYRKSHAFRLATTSTALSNAEHFALFVRALNGYIPSNLLLGVGLTVGRTFVGGESGWFGTVFADVELNRPVLRIFNPVLRLSLTGFGVRDDGQNASMKDEKVYVASLMAGLRVGNPRGPRSPFGELGVSAGITQGDISGKVLFGGHAALGYRWQRIEITAGVDVLDGRDLGSDVRAVWQLGLGASFKLTDILSGRQ